MLRIGEGTEDPPTDRDEDRTMNATLDADEAAVARRNAGAPRSARFWNRLAARYARRPIADMAAYEKKLQITRAYFTPETEVLEVGCGTGSTALLHAPHVGHVHGIDFSAKMIEIANEKAAASGLDNVSFERASVEELALPDGSQDVIMAMSLLHLLEDRDATLAALYRMLKPGGVLVSSTVCIAEKMGWFRWIAPIGRTLGVLPRINVLARADLRDSLAGAGFEIDQVWDPENGMTTFVVAKKPTR